MTREIIFDKETFSKTIKNYLSTLDADTTEKLRSLMKEEAESNVAGVNSDLSTLLKDFKKTVTITPKPAKNVTFPDEVYTAIMHRVIAVEAPKITGDEFQAGSIIKAIGGYISDLLNPNTETVKGYTLSNPFGSTLAYVTVTDADGKSYNFTWNDSKTKASFNSFMEKLNDFAKERAIVGVFTALLDDAKNAGLVDAGKDLLSEWAKAFKNAREWNKLTSELAAASRNDWDFLGLLATYKKSKNSLVDSAAKEVSDEFKTIIEPYKTFFNKISTPLKKVIEFTTIKAQDFAKLTGSLFSNNKNAINAIQKKYDTLIEESVDFASFITNYSGTDEALIAELNKKSSAYQNFVTAYNALQTQIGQSKTAFPSTFEDYTSYRITDAHNETINDNNALVTGTNQNDIINIQSQNVKFYGGEGADDIIASSRHITLIGEQGNDHFFLNDVASNNYVDAGNDDDTILSYGKNNTIYSGNGNDSILVSAYSDFTKKNEVRGGAGNDTINVTAAMENTVLGDDGDDLIQISQEADGNTIIGGKGNDSIEIEDADHSFIVYSEGDGDDTITGLDSNDTLYIAEGDFSRSTIGADVIVYVGNGAITLKDAADKNLNIMKPLTYDDLFKNIQSNKVIFGTQQDDTINNTVDGATIDAGDGSNYIYNTGWYIAINAGAGNDTVSNEGGLYSKIGTDSGNDSITNDAANVTISAGAGDDFIYNEADTYWNFDTTAWKRETIVPDKVIISGDEGNDKIENSGGSEVTIKGGAGNDSIINHSTGYINWNELLYDDGGRNAIVDGGAGDDSITNAGSNVTINGGSGNDSIANGDYNNDMGANTSINAGTGDDSVYNGGDSITIDGGAGDDKISNAGINFSISGGEGDDSIYIYSIGDSSKDTMNTINGGTGDDTITNVWSINTKILYRYYLGDGNDLIKGFYETSMLSISGGSYSTTKSGSDIIVTVGDGKITLQGAADLSTFNIIGTETESDDTATDDTTSDDTAYDDAATDDTTDDTAYDDTAYDDTAYDDTAYDDTAYDDTTDDTAYDDTAYDDTAYDDTAYDDTAYDDTAYDDTATDDTAYDDTATDDTAYDDTAYDDTAYDDTTSDDTTYDDTAYDDTAYDDTTYDDTLEILASDKLDSPSIILEPRFKSVDATKYKKAIQITGNELDNSIAGGKKNDTLDGAGGNDTLTGGAGKNNFVYTSGNDVITDYKKQDRINTSSNYESYEIDDNDLVFNFGGEKSLTIQNGTSKQINMNSNSNYYTADGVLDKRKKSITLLATTENFVADSKVMTIDGSAISSAINITGNKKKNYIIAGANGSTLTGGKGNDTLVGGAGADLFIYENKTGKDVIEGFSAGDSISLDSSVTIKDAKIKGGNSVIKFKGGALTVNNTTEFKLGETVYRGGVFIAGDSAKVYGSYKGEINLADYAVNNFDASQGKKKLTITGNDSANSLQGGKKNDTLWGGAGSDIFIYQAGGGKDVIADYTASDMLQILDKKGDAGTFNKATFKDNSLTLNVKGGGKVILDDITSSTSININGNNRTVSELIK